jgi:hypothetical protein
MPISCLGATILHHHTPLLAQNNDKTPQVREIRGNQDLQLIRQQRFATNKGIFTRVRFPSPDPSSRLINQVSLFVNIPNLKNQNGNKHEKQRGDANHSIIIFIIISNRSAGIDGFAR